MKKEYEKKVKCELYNDHFQRENERIRVDRMNKYQEAFNELIEDYNDLIQQKSYLSDYYEWYGTQEKIDLLQELVDKATPVKARADSVGCYCGNCAYRLGDNNGWTQATVKYCGNCGQKLDWSVEE